MASVLGVRFGGQRAPLLLRPVAANIYRIATAKPTGVRHYSHPRHDHFAINEFGLLSTHVPVPWRHRPSIFTRAGLESAKTHVVETVRGVFSQLTLMYHLSGWRTKAFATQAEALCETMNEAFAEGDLRTLNGLCFPSMAASLKNDIKRRKAVLDWRKVRSVTPPKIVQMTCGRLSSDMTVGQVIVRVDQEQIVAPATARSSGPRSATPVRVAEYVVFQRVITDPASPWRIFCKLSVPKWDPVFQK
ncbi:hypothetical protein H4S07_005481 [Coemansia furcata]|uniref:Uncharacterized protein n=1 Tax=Coemansia furcata TaxID=417177 RepID=A0ACC1L1N7_9FUNG|nr:hypothetical protein H4S07_005481 [Coemansia furcata]